jgi:ankyrin repeat protein
VHSAKIDVDSEILVPVSVQHGDLGKISSSQAPEYQVLLTFIRGVMEISQSRIRSGFPEVARSEIKSIAAEADHSDHASISSESQLDIPGDENSFPSRTIGTNNHTEKERRFLRGLRKNWVDGSSIPENECGTHSWLEESPQWKEWTKGDDILWITGAQGLGKTHLAKFIIKSLHRDMGLSAAAALKRRPSGYETLTPDPSHLVLSYFCDARRPSTHEHIEILKSLLHQILSQDCSLFKYIYGLTSIFPRPDQGTFAQFRQGLAMILNAKSREGGVVDIIIDAIDECDKQSRLDIYGFLTSLEVNPKVKVILTCRPELDIPRSLAIRLDRNHDYHQQDLRPAIQEAVNELALRRRFTVGFAREIFDNIWNKTNGMLAAQICLDLLEKMPNVHATREALQRLPQNVHLSDLFLQLLDLRTDSNRSTLILSYFFTCCSRRNLLLDELLALLASTTSSSPEQPYPHISDIHESVDLNVEQTLKRFPRPFLEVQNGTVALVHGALADFLLSPEALQYFLAAIKEFNHNKRFRLTAPTEGLVQCLMAEACLKYMYAAVQGRFDPLQASGYCFEYWSEHTREARRHCSEELLNLVSDFLDPQSQESQETYSKMKEYLNDLNEYRLLPPTNEFPYVLAAFNLCDVLADRLCLPAESFQVPDSSGHLPLHYAASNDAVESAEWILKEFKKLGLEIGDIVNRPAGNASRLTPAELATQKGRVSMVDMFLDEVGDDLEFVLSLMPMAVKCGQRAVFASLWTKCSESATELSITQRESILNSAIKMDNEAATLKLLGDQSSAQISPANLNLYLAVETQSPQMVQELIQRDADVNVRNSQGSFPLHIAASVGNDPIVEKLLGAGAKINQRDGMRRTPLHLATSHGFLHTCSILLQHGSSVNIVDNLGRLPAHYASDIGHDKLLKLLLANGSDTLSIDNDKRTMLMLAARKGHDNVVRLLLEDPMVDIDVNALDVEDKTALHHAVSSGNVSVVSRLLIAGAAINARDIEGSSPLHIAAKESADIVVNELLQNGADANVVDNNGRTPLHQALRQAYPSGTAVHALLERDVEVNKQDIEGCVALHYAARNCHLHSIILLVQHGARSVKNKAGKFPVEEIPAGLVTSNDSVAKEIEEQLSETI